jgi:hypothetical protein
MKVLEAILCSATIFVPLSYVQGQVPATERAAAGLPAGQTAAPNTPGGGAVIGRFLYVTDAAWGFRNYQPADLNNPDPINNGTLIFNNANDGRSMGGTALCVFFCHAGQVAYDGNQTVYITAYDQPKGQPGSVDMPGVWRATIDPVQGFITPNARLVPNAGLQGNQPASIALGPDGSLYVGFLKNGNVVRILNPSLDPSNPAQIVQSVGTSPNGRPIRGLAFAGSDLYLASTGGLSVIKNAVSPTCLGGCNGTVVADGFSGTAHLGIASDGINRLYMAIDGQGVWRYTISNGTMHLVSTGGDDPNTGLPIRFALVGGNSNLVMLDRLGNLWIGDDPSDGHANFSGRIWYISAAALGSLP